MSVNKLNFRPIACLAAFLIASFAVAFEFNTTHPTVGNPTQVSLAFYYDYFAGLA